MKSSKSPNILWHYTDASGFLGILQSTSFWASSATYLNDDQELNYGQDRLIQSLRSVANEIEGGDFHNETGFHLRIEADKLAGRLGPYHVDSIPSIPDTYIVSFCQKGDLLSQWRGYSEGSGFALGFDREELEQAAREKGTQARLEKVRYGEKAGTEMFEPLIWAQIEKNQNSESRKSRNPSLIPFDATNTEEILREVGWCKHPAFEDEEEWRLKIDQPESVKVRSRGGDLLPYTPFEFPRFALKEVRLGPGGFRDLREAAVKHALEAEGLRVFDYVPEVLPDISSLAAHVNPDTGEPFFSEEDLKEEEKKRAEAEAEARAEAEAKADVRISRSSAPYRP